ncbi:repressor of filamentous growth 1-like isoform X2 [Hermetia illucens]|nr:repressor of filamentous growth 1-like isoform X2 [Hermetia illucens]
MPPQPPGASATLYGDAPIPGAAPIELSTTHISTNITLRTHSSKFPIERELVLSSGDKGSTKIPLMNDRTSGLQHLLPRSTSGAVAPDHPPKQLQAWNTQHQTTQSQQHSQDSLHPNLTGAIPRTPARLPEDVTALAERENNKDRDAKDSKNAVTKTYHTIKDLISSKFKKDCNETVDELNNVIAQQQNHSGMSCDPDELRSPYSALPVHMRQMQSLNQSQPNIWNGGKVGLPSSANQMSSQVQCYTPDPSARNGNGMGGSSGGVQQRAASQPQLNVTFERRGSQTLLDNVERRGSLANIDVTDSDDGGFASRTRRPQTMYQVNMQTQQQQQQQQQQYQHQQQSQQQLQHQQQQQFHQQQQQYQQQNQANQAFPSQLHRKSPHISQNNASSHTTITVIGPQQGHTSSPYQQHQQQFQSHNQSYQQYTSPYMHVPSPQSVQAHQNHTQQQIQLSNITIQSRQDILRASFQKHQEMQKLQLQQSTSAATIDNPSGQQENVDEAPPKLQPRADHKSKQMPSSAASSDYDKSGNHSSNVDSGRGSAAYSSGRKGTVADTSPESSDSHVRPKETESEWVDIVDAELRNILEPGMQSLNLRPESTVSGSVSSITPPLPPLSPDGSSKVKANRLKDTPKQEYGMDSYNRPGRSSGPIGPSRAGWPGSTVQKQSALRASGKKQDQSLLKRHLFGLDNDQTSTTTRSLDLESLLGGPWGAGQSVSDSETDTQGLRHIRSQLEGLEHMYSEVLRMLGSRLPNSRSTEATLRSTRRRHGSLSSLPSSSVSSRPIRDRRRSDDRRKVRDMKGINKRFQRLESHVVTLARSVAHLSSELRSQHLVTQELERLRDDLTTLRSQAVRMQNVFGTNGKDPEPPNLTNPKRVKKLTKFFGEDPPLMRLFLKKLGYEKYASLFEAERVGMVELPYLGEERLQKLGVPLGPRLRILQEAQISLCKDTTLCIV